MSDVTIPVVYLEPYLTHGQTDLAAKLQARIAAEAFVLTGVVNVYDPRMPEGLDARFLELTQRYFGQPVADKQRDERADNGHQIGWTPPYTEKPRDRAAMLDELRASGQMTEADYPATYSWYRLKGGRSRDAKERFFERVGPRPERTKYPGLNAPTIVPAAFPEWQEVTTAWSRHMLASLMTTLELVALGFGMEADAFTRLMQFAPHLLAPTGSDLATHTELGTPFAGFHSDLNLATIHGNSSYPGLFGWTRNWERFLVRVPQGCCLVQAGMQLERLTGGRVLAGFHEVVLTEEAAAMARQAIAESRSPWRTSTTVFGHAGSDAILEPLGRFASAEARRLYPPIEAGAQVLEEIKAIDLLSEPSSLDGLRA